MYNLLATLYLIVFVGCGLCVARLVFPGCRPLPRLWQGGVFGLAMLLWLPALFSFAFGRFTILTNLLALAAAVIAAGMCYIAARKKEAAKAPWVKEKPVLYTLLPLAVIGIILFYTHTLVPRDGALYVGQSTYGDLAMHLGFITSIAVQGTFPPMYSILPDTAIGYPFLSDSISSTFYVLGADLSVATMLPAILAYILLLLGVYMFFETWLKRRGSVVLATLLFFIGGGFGFAYFLNNAQLDPSRLANLFEAFYQTPTNFPAEGLRWVNAIADMVIPQRATLFGWALLFPCLQMLYRFVMEGEKRLMIPLGILAGCLPLVHTHSFLALGVVSAFLFIVECIRSKEKKSLIYFLGYGCIAVALAAPQLFLFTFKQSESFLKFNWNWANESDSFIWFYIKNLGLIFLLMPSAFCYIKKQDKIFYGGALALWALAETIQFQPNPYDNNKLLFIWFAMTVGIVSSYLMHLYDRNVDAGARMKQITTLGSRIAQRILIGIVLVSLFLSGTLTLMREYRSEYLLFDAEQVAAAEFIKENTEPDAVFLTYNNHNNAVASLTGRNIVVGTGTYLYFHGVNYQDRQNNLSAMYTKPAQSKNLYEEYGVDYVFLSDTERGKFQGVDVDYFENNYDTVYDEGSITIYRVK